MRWPAPAAATIAALLVGLAGCGDDPFSFRWSDVPDTAQLYSLARPEFNLRSGYSFAPPPSPSVVEGPNATGSWDIAVDTRDDQLVFLPPGALGITARAGVAVLGTIDFDDVVDAPEDTTRYENNAPIPVVAGTVYIVKTNRRTCSFGSSGVYYAKVEPVIIDVPGGSLVFRYVASPICNSRSLVPPE
jgi:hypothetical protein